ncbi:MAG: hypothetical protein ACFFCZ_09755 [Promethearchaeota archaeon]
MTIPCRNSKCRGEMVPTPTGYVCNVCGLVEDKTTFLTKQRDEQTGFKDSPSPKMEVRHTGKLVDTEKSSWDDLINFSEQYDDKKRSSSKKSKEET